MAGPAGATVIADLPSIDGEIEAGIATGTDQRLANDHKIKVYRPDVGDGENRHGIEAVHTKSATLRWVYDVYNGPKRVILMNAASVIIDLGLIAINDSDFSDMREDSDYRQNAANDDAIKAMVTQEEMRKALTLIVGTKANYWLMNHHTGQGDFSGYAHKISKIFYAAEPNDEMMIVAHQIGHWASTRMVLACGDVANILDSESVFIARAVLRLTDDAKLRFRSLPAGTHKVSNAYVGARRLCTSVYVAVCPSAHELIQVCPLYRRIEAEPAKYHIGALFLTGEHRIAYDESSATGILGRVGTYIRNVLGRSTLARSPHFQEDKVQSYDDYSPEFVNAINAIKTTSVTQTNEALEAIVQTTLKLTKVVADQIGDAFGITVTVQAIKSSSDDDLEGSTFGDEGSDDEGRPSKSKKAKASTSAVAKGVRASSRHPSKGKK